MLREIERKHAQFKHQSGQRRIKKCQKFRERDRGSFTTKINNRLSKRSSVKLKAAKDSSSARNNHIGGKESLVQSNNVDQYTVYYR